MLILGEEKGRMLNTLSSKKEYYEFLETLQQLLTLSRGYTNDGKKLLGVQKHLYEILIIFETEIKKSSNSIDIFMYKQLRATAKSITDGILWREADYNRVYISMLSYAKGPGNIKNDVSKTIQKIAKEYLGKNNIILINDISNQIRVGDYLIINSGKIIDILEVKGTKIRGIKYYKNHPTGRQSGKMVNTFNELESFPTKSVNIKINYFEQLNNNIEKAYKIGHSSEKLNKYTFVRVMYSQNFKDADGLIKNTKKLTRVITKNKEDIIHTFSNYDFYHNKNNRYLSAVFAPYSIFPFPSITCIYLMAGILQVTTYINVSGIKREFEKDGWIIEETKKSSKINSNDDMNASNMFYENKVDMSLFKIRKKDGYFSHFSISELQLIAFEFKSYKSIINNHNNDYKEAKKDKSSGAYLLTFESDKEIFF